MRTLHVLVISIPYTFPISHESITVTYPWLILTITTTHLVTLSQQQRAHRCMCVSTCVPARLGLGANSRHVSVVRSYWVWSARLLFVRFKWRQLTLVFGNKPTEVICGDRNWINGLCGKALRWGSTVSQNALWLSPQTKGSTRCTQLRHSSKKQRAYSACAYSNMKRKTNLC